MKDEINLRSYGKINLCLDVLRRRGDGYHEVRMIMQTVSLFDRLALRRTAEPGIRIRSNLPYLPTGPENLAYRAAALLMDEFCLDGGIFLNLYKRIPVAAGMAGGSSNAAAVLVGVNRLFGLGLSRKELMERAVSLGADVPYCVMRGTALAEGIGEKLSPLPPMPDCHILLAKPPFSVSTKSVYGSLKAEELEAHPDVDGVIRSLEAGDLKGIAAGMGNVLETVTIPAYPRILRIKECMEQSGALAALMSGSGPTVFGIFESLEEAEEAARKIRDERLTRQVYTVRPYNSRNGA